MFMFKWTQLGEDVNSDLQHVSFLLPDSEEMKGSSSGEAQQGDNFIDRMLGTQLFELYLALHEFCKCKEGLPSRYCFLYFKKV